MVKTSRNSQAFLREWRVAARSLPPRDARILADVALRGKRLAQVGREHNLSRERVRQIADQSIRALRRAARQNPQCELGRALEAVQAVSESAAIETWSVKRLSQRGKDAVARMLVRLDVIVADQAHLAPAVCFLAERPRERRASLNRMANDVRNILLVHPSGLSPGDVRRRLKEWHEPMRTWPRLDIRMFAAARMDVVTTQGGKMRLAANTEDAALPRKTMAQRLELALHQAGRCLNYKELAERVRQAEAAEGDHAPRFRPIRAHTARSTLSRDPRFQWVGRGTYGLTEWDVGLSTPRQASGRRPSVTMEIEHLLDQRGCIPVPELMEHLTRRLRVKEKTIRRIIRRNPAAEIRKGVLRRIDPNDPRSGAEDVLGPIEPLTMDEVKRCRRQADVLRELALRNGGMADIAVAAELTVASGMTTNTRRGIASNLHSHVSSSGEWARLGRNRVWLLEFGPAPCQYPG